MSGLLSEMKSCFAVIRIVELNPVAEFVFLNTVPFGFTTVPPLFAVSTIS